jgi:hypothetical protein
MIVRDAEFESVRNARFWDTGIYSTDSLLLSIGMALIIGFLLKVIIFDSISIVEYNY